MELVRAAYIGGQSMNVVQVSASVSIMADHIEAALTKEDSGTSE